MSSSNLRYRCIVCTALKNSEPKSLPCVIPRTGSPALSSHLLNSNCGHRMFSVHSNSTRSPSVCWSVAGRWRGPPHGQRNPMGATRNLLRHELCINGNKSCLNKYIKYLALTSSREVCVGTVQVHARKEKGSMKRVMKHNHQKRTGNAVPRMTLRVVSLMLISLLFRPTQALAPLPAS